MRIQKKKRHSKISLVDALVFANKDEFFPFAIVQACYVFRIFIQNNMNIIVL